MNADRGLTVHDLICPESPVSVLGFVDLAVRVEIGIAIFSHVTSCHRGIPVISPAHIEEDE